jgi:BirA family biotin operon repressor/biotin-[acetyl-CoA-carboxylase] ligase
MQPREFKAHSNLLNDYHLLAFDELDSTNEEAKRLARAGGGHGAVIWAKKQTKGRGRLGREWVSKDGNLFFSVLLSPDKPMEELAELSFVASSALVDAIQPVLEKGHKLTCKWPNDILMDGKKIAGILIESFEHEGKKWVVVGMGVNIDSAPSHAMYPAACLTDAGVELISAKIVLSRCIHHFIETYNTWHNHGFGIIRKRWQLVANHFDNEVTAKLPDGDITGIAQGIDTQGGLIIKDANGKKHTIFAADIFPAEGA